MLKGIYEAKKVFVNNYKNAITEEEKEQIRVSYNTFENVLESVANENPDAFGTKFMRVLDTYEWSTDLENDCFVIFNDSSYYFDSDEMMETMKKCGVKKVALASRATTVTEVAKKLEEHGYKITGMTTVNVSKYCFGTEKFEKAPAFKFEI